MCRRCSTYAKRRNDKLFLQDGIMNAKNVYLSYSLHNTIISICAFMAAGESFKSWVFYDLEGNSVFGPKLLKLSHNTVCDVRYTC